MATEKCHHIHNYPYHLFPHRFLAGTAHSTSLTVRPCSPSLSEAEGRAVSPSGDGSNREMGKTPAR